MALVDIIKDIKDPERPETLEELNVLSEESVQVKKLSDRLIQTTGSEELVMARIELNSDWQLNPDQLTITNILNSVLCTRTYMYLRKHIL